MKNLPKNIAEEKFKTQLRGMSIAQILLLFVKLPWSHIKEKFGKERPTSPRE